MNRYGLMAQKHWARWLPARYAQIEDPDSFFSDLGKQAAEQIDSLALRLAGDDQPGEGYLGKAGRLGQARHQAEEIVLADLILLEPEPGADEETEDPADRRRVSPAPEQLTAFRPAGQDDLAPSGAVSRVRANLAALATLHSVQDAGRPATAGEQRVMARWSGWGAVPEVFDNGREEFAWAREQLASLLTPQELAAAPAARSTPTTPTRLWSRRCGQPPVSSGSTAARCWSRAAGRETSSVSLPPPRM